MRNCVQYVAWFWRYPRGIADSAPKCHDLYDRRLQMVAGMHDDAVRHL